MRVLRIVAIGRIQFKKIKKRVKTKDKVSGERGAFWNRPRDTEKEKDNQVGGYDQKLE